MRTLSVVGAGVIGLSVAWRAAAAGWRVRLHDPTAGRGASWVAGGMLAPLTEGLPGEDAALQLGSRSLERWPDVRRGSGGGLGDAVRAATGRHPGGRRRPGGSGRAQTCWPAGWQTAAAASQPCARRALRAREPLAEQQHSRRTGRPRRSRRRQPRAAGRPRAGLLRQPASRSIRTRSRAPRSCRPTRSSSPPERGLPPWPRRPGSGRSRARFSACVADRAHCRRRPARCGH